MKRSQVILTLVIASAVFLTAFPASAQGRRPYSPYQPARPTISPWFNLYRQDGGVLDNYHTFVRPEIQLRNTLRQQEYNISRQGMDIQAMRQNMSGVTRTLGMRPTGAGSRFMDYSHYYQFQRTMSRR